MSDSISADITQASEVRHFAIEVNKNGANEIQIRAILQLVEQSNEIKLTFGSDKSNNIDNVDEWKDATQVTDRGQQQFVHELNIGKDESQLEAFWFIRLTVESDDNAETQVYYRRLYFSQIPLVNKDDSDQNALFPEREVAAYDGRLDSAVCFSGGGTRAMLLAMGQLRFLTEKKYTQKLGYMSSVSGGSWAASSYTFTDINNREKLLGKYRDVNQLNRLDRAAVPQLAQGATKTRFLVRLVSHFIQGLVGNAMLDATSRAKLSERYDEDLLNVGSRPLSRFWLDAVESCFFEPTLKFPIDDTESSNFLPATAFTLDSESKRKIDTMAGTMSDSVEYFHTVNTELNDKAYPPYYVANGLMLQPFNGNANHYAPYEFTPLYHGAGFDGQWGTGARVMNVGGIAPMFSFDSHAVSTSDDNKIWLWRSETDAFSGSLGTASGISSSAFAGAASNLYAILIAHLLKAFFCGGKQPLPRSLARHETTALDGLLAEINAQEVVDLGVDAFVTQLSNASGKSVEKQSVLDDICWLVNDLQLESLVPKANMFWHSESGFIRRTRVINNQDVLFGDAGLSDNLGLMSMLRRGVRKIVVFVNSEAPFEAGNIIDITVPAYFGRFYSTTGEEITPSVGFDGVDLRFMQVFESEAYDGLVTQFEQAKQDDKPLVASTKLKVKANDKWDIAGGYEVEVLWYYNSMPHEWQQSLPDNIKQQLADNFPYVSTMGGTIWGVNDTTIHMLSNLAEYNLRATEDKIRELLQ